VGKPIALFNTSPRATYAQASLIEIVTTMAGRIVPEASLTVSLLGKKLNAAGIISDWVVSSALRASMITFATAIEALRAEAVPL
jgi:hypothetical protein